MGFIGRTPTAQMPSRDDTTILLIIAVSLRRRRLSPPHAMPRARRAARAESARRWAMRIAASARRAAEPAIISSPGDVPQEMRGQHARMSAASTSGRAAEERCTRRSRAIEVMMMPANTGSWPRGLQNYYRHIARRQEFLFWR